MRVAHTLYKSRTGIGEYRLIMSSATAGGGDDLRYKYLCLIRYGVHVRRSSHLDSTATKAELEGWGEVVTDEDDRAEILRCVTCIVMQCSGVVVEGRKVCEKHLKAAQPGKPAGRHRKHRRGNR